MSLNKRQLKEDQDKLDKPTRKLKPKRTKWIQRGQQSNPGDITGIMGNTMDTSGYGDIPLFVRPDNDLAQIVQANSGTHVFPHSSSFVETPIEAEGGWLDTYQTGGNAPVYVSDPKDPRLLAYRDSSELYDIYSKNKNLILNGGNFYLTPEVGRPVKTKKSEKFSIPNPNNPISYHKVDDNFGFNEISDNGLPDINIVRKAGIHPLSTEVYTRKESQYKTEAEYKKAAAKMKSFSEEPGKVSKIDYMIQSYKKPVQPVKYKKAESKSEPPVETPKALPKQEVPVQVKPEFKDGFYYNKQNNTYWVRQDSTMRPTTETTARGEAQRLGQTIQEFRKGGTPKLGQIWDRLGRLHSIKSYVPGAQAGGPVPSYIAPPQYLMSNEDTSAYKTYFNRYLAGKAEDRANDLIKTPLRPDLISPALMNKLLVEKNAYQDAMRQLQSVNKQDGGWLDDYNI